MSKKTLLNETQVRRFMKLSQLGTLSDGFVNGLSEAGYFTNEQEEELPGDEGPVDDMEMGGDEELPMDDMAMDDESEMGDDLEDAAGESLPPEVVSQVEDALAQALGAMETALEEAIPELDLSVEQTDDMDAEMGDDMEMEMGDDMGDEDPMADMDMDAEMGPEEEPAPEDELVERIVRRVAERLRDRKGNK